MSSEKPINCNVSEKESTKFEQMFNIICTNSYIAKNYLSPFIYQIFKKLYQADEHGESYSIIVKMTTKMHI